MSDSVTSWSAVVISVTFAVGVSEVTVSVKVDADDSEVRPSLALLIEASVVKLSLDVEDSVVSTSVTPVSASPVVKSSSVENPVVGSMVVIGSDELLVELLDVKVDELDVVLMLSSVLSGPGV